MEKQVPSSVLMVEAAQVHIEVVNASEQQPPIELNKLLQVLSLSFDDRAVRTGIWDAIESGKVILGKGLTVLPAQRAVA